jgi:hypothetical protein
MRASCYHICHRLSELLCLTSIWVELGYEMVRRVLTRPEHWTEWWLSMFRYEHLRRCVNKPTRSNGARTVKPRVMLAVIQWAQRYGAIIVASDKRGRGLV